MPLLDTISVLDRLHVDRCRSTVHNWVQKADLQPLDGADPDSVAVVETVIQLDDERYWLYAAVDADTNRLLHVRLFPTGTQALTEMFLSELREKHRVDDALFLVDSRPGCRQPVTVTDSDSGIKSTRIGTASNASSER